MANTDPGNSLHSRGRLCHGWDSRRRLSKAKISRDAYKRFPTLVVRGAHRRCLSGGPVVCLQRIPGEFV